MTNKYLNVRIGVEFYNKLNSHQAFQLNWKAISPAFYFLQRIAKLNDMEKGKAVEFYSGNVQNIFKPYCKTNEGDYAYWKYIHALEQLQLLTVNNSYVVGDGESIEGHCKSFLVTPEAVDLLSTSNVEYLKALHSNKEVIRRNKDNIRKRVTHSYQDYVLNYIHDGLTNYTYDFGQAMAMVTGSGWSPMTQQAAEQSLIAFKTKDFGTLNYNETDGRVFNEFVAMKSDLRKAFKYNKMERKAVIDIRACHPTFFSTYLLEYVITNPIEAWNGYNNSKYSSILYPLHYVTDNFRGQDDKIEIVCDRKHTCHKKCENKEQLLKQLQLEHSRWLALFTNPLIDPRDVIGNEIDRTKAEVKEALNQSLNGSTKHKRFLEWLAIQFPCLFVIWQSTDVKHTGNKIACLYESKIMLNAALYKQTEAQGLKIAYEYDGISVFSSDIKSVLVDKVEYLAKQIQHLAKQQCGIDMVLKVEFI